MKKFIESFSTEGSCEKNLMEALKELSDCTETILINPENLFINSVESVCKEGFKILHFEPEFTSARDLFPIKRNITVFSKENNNYFLLSKDEMKKKGIDPVLIEESGFYMEYEDKIILADENFLSVLCRQLGINKLQGYDSIRDLYLTYLLGYAEPFKMTIRREGNLCRAIYCYSENHNRMSQYDIVKSVITELKAITQIKVGYFNISQSCTQIRISLPELTSITDIENKRKRLDPSLYLTVSDIGSITTSIQFYLGINGRGIFIGESKALPKKQEENLNAAIRLFFKTEIASIKRCIKKIEKTTDNKVEYKATYEKILNSIKLKNDISAVIYKALMKNAETKYVSARELLFDILDMPGVINSLIIESKGKEVPEYAIKNCEKILGRLFNSSVCKEVFKW